MFPWRRLLSIAANSTHRHALPPYSHTISFAHFSTSFLVTKTPKKFRKKRKKPESPRSKLVQTPPNLIHHFENLLRRDTRLRFLSKTKDHLLKQPERVIQLADAGKLHQQLGFRRGQKVVKFLHRHPLIFSVYRHDDDKMWLGFTDYAEKLLLEEKKIMDEMESHRVEVIRKLLMMSVDKRIQLSKIYHNRHLFGIREDLRDWVCNFPEHFKVVVEDDGRRILELVKWDPSLAVSSLEKKFMVDEDSVKKAFKFGVKHGRELGLDERDERKLNLLMTLPLVSPYSDGTRFDLWTVEAEKYRVGVIHEFLSLTLEKRAYIHNIVEFKDEFCLTKHTYSMLLKQPRSFYLAGTEMNWCVFLKDGYGEFLKDGYGEDGVLVDKDPQVVFNEKLYKFAEMEEMGSNEF